MRIVIDARESGTSTGRYIDKLVEYLHKLKPEHEIIVMTKAARIKYLRNVAPDFKIIESKYREFGFGEQTGFLSQLRKLRPDLVHFGMTQQPVLYKGRKITTIHDLTTAIFDNPAKNPAIFKAKQRVYKSVIKSVAKNSQAIITPSEFVKKEVVSYAGIKPGKIVVTYEAADKISEEPSPLPRLINQQFIMYVGRATPHKNIERLIKAFILLRQKHPDLKLVLAGKTDANYNRISQMVTDRRIADAVVFTGFVTEGELRWLYENTLAYVFPSLSEGFGLPGLEAMAHGAAVISSNSSCLPEIYGGGAYYFDPRSTSDMAKKIDAIVSHQALRLKLAQRGRIQSSNYSWIKMAKQTLSVYEQTLKA